MKGYIRNLTGMFLIFGIVFSIGVFIFSIPYEVDAATSVKVGNFQSGISTGNVSVTGVGFQPKAVIFFWTRQGATGFSTGERIGEGFAAGSPIVNRSVTIACDDGVNPTSCGRRRSETYSIIFLSSGSPTLSGQGSVTAFGADGFTVNWNTAPGVNAYINYIAIGGADITNIKAGTITASTSTGNQSFTGVGFQPDFVMFLSSLTESVDTNTTNMLLNTGFMTPAGQAAVSVCGRDNENSTSHARSQQRTDMAIMGMTTSCSQDSLASYVSMNADGFTLNFSDAPSNSTPIFYLALKGGAHAVGSFNQPTSGTAPFTVDYTGVGFQPVGLFMESFNRTDGTIIAAQGEISIGAASSSTARGTIWGENRDVISTDVNMSITTNTAIRLATTSTINAEADFSDFLSDGFRLNWTTRSDTTARQIVYWTIGNSPPTTTVGDGTSPANKFAGPNNTNKAVSSFTLSTNSGTDTVTGMIITGTNTANAAASGVKIYRDNGTTANEWDASDTLAGTASFSGNTATFTGLNIAVSTTSTQYIITYDITASPTNGQTLTGVVTSVTCTNPVTNNDSTDATITIDAAAPTTTDNQTSSDWQATEKTVTLTPNDGTGSGVTAATGIYGCFGTGCSPALLGGSTMTTNCGAGNECTYDVRYYSVDNVGNTESTKTSAYQARIDRKTPTDGTLTATAGNGQVSLSWSGFSDSGSGLNTTDTYKLVFLTTGFPNANCSNGTDLTAVTTQTNYTHTGLTNGTTYYYRICAYDAVNNISAGVTTSATPLSVPTLSYPASPYDDGMDPDTGDTTTNFTFKVIYTDSENDAPASGYPKIYIGDNDGYASYAMSLDTSAAASLKDGIYTNGEQYVYGPIGLGAAEDLRFYFEAKAATGSLDIVKLPSNAPTDYSTGPAVYLMQAYNMVGVPKDLGTGLSYSSVFGDDSGHSYCIFWDSTGLDTVDGYSGSWSFCTSGNIEKRKGYYIWAIDSDYYRLDEPSGVGNVTDASVDIALDPDGGWNMITNPYNVNIQLQNVKVVRGATEYTFSQAVTNNYIGNSIYEWEGSVTGYTFKAYNGSPPATLDPWVGYFIYVKDTTPTTLRVYKP